MEFASALQEAVRNARVPRGTDDAGNDWLVDFPSGECSGSHPRQADSDHRPNEASAPVHEYVSDERSAEQHDEAIFVLMTSHELSELCCRLASDAGRHTIEGHLHDQQGLERVLYQNLWEKCVHDLTVMMDASSNVKIVGAVFMQFGTTFTTQLRGTDPMGNKKLAYHDQEALRLESLLAARTCELIEVFAQRGVPWMIVVPHAPTVTPTSISE